VIDWPFVAVHSLWILGLSIILAALAYHNWLRQELGRPWRTQWREPAWRVPHFAGLMLIAVSIAVMTPSSLWERILWSILACVWARELHSGWQMWRRSTSSQPQDGSHRPQHDPQIEQ
jgi:hypothetical protein